MSKKIKISKKALRRQQKYIAGLHREIGLKDTIIENQVKELVAMEEAIRGVRASQAEQATGSRDFGRGWNHCMSAVEEALLRVQSIYRHPSSQQPTTRVITEMELLGVSLDMYGAPHSEIRLIDWKDGEPGHVHIEPPQS